MSSTTTPTILKNTKKGYPLLLFSAKPYSAFNFQTCATFKMVGNYTWVGLIGMATDAENYIVARCSMTRVQIIKVRNGFMQILAEDYIAENRGYITVMFSHKDGLFSVRQLIGGYFTDPILTYRWKESDGPLSTDPDLYHVGVYSCINPPHFRITSYSRENCDGIPYLPGTDDSTLSLFPDSGWVTIDDSKYYYQSRKPWISELTNITNFPGPFQVKSTGAFTYTNPDSGIVFSGKAAEAAMFDWRNLSNDFNDLFFATDAQYAWTISAVDRKNFISPTTWLRNRARFFCPHQKGVVSTTHRAWITTGLTGIDTSWTSESINPQHDMGSLCFLDSDDFAQIEMFRSSSGDTDATIGDMLNMVTRMAGATPLFSGDKVIPSMSLSKNRTTL